MVFAAARTTSALQEQLSAAQLQLQLQDAEFKAKETAYITELASGAFFPLIEIVV